MENNHEVTSIVLDISWFIYAISAKTYMYDHLQGLAVTVFWYWSMLIKHAIGWKWTIVWTQNNQSQAGILFILIITLDKYMYYAYSFFQDASSHLHVYLFGCLFEVYCPTQFFFLLIWWCYHYRGEGQHIFT